MSEENSKSNTISGIYKIENLINHKVYIGQSKNIYERWNQHKRNSNNPKYKKYLIYRAISKYGIENFSFEIIKETYDLDYWEIFLIQIYNSTNDKFGYNLHKGGNFSPMKNKHHTEETKRKLSEINKGKKLSKESIEKMRKNRIGKCYISDEKKKEISERMKGNKYWLGKHHSKESIEKMKNRKISKETGNKISEKLKGHRNWSVAHTEDSKLKQRVTTKLIYLMYKDYKNKKLFEGKFNDFQKEYKGKYSSDNWKIFEEYFDDLKSIVNNLYDELNKPKEIKSKYKVYIKCLETQEIHSATEWKQLGYKDAYVVANGKQKTCHGLHFEHIDKPLNYFST